MTKSVIWLGLCLWCVFALGCTTESDDQDGTVGGIGANGGTGGVAGTMIAGGAGGAGATGGAGNTGGAGGASGNAGTGGTGGAGAGMGGGTTAGSGGDGIDMPDAAADAMVDESARDGWSLTFQDEFNDPEGTGVDTTKWTPVNKGDGFGNNELEFYTPRTENARTDGDGSLIIEVREEDYMGRDFTSARLETKDTFEQTYGRFEIRAKLPFGQGIWPAFWTLGNDISDVSWPQCGEIDIMEHVGKTPSTNYGSLHGPGYSGGNPLSAQYMLENDERFADDFHEYAIEWEEDVVRWYVDGNLYETRTPDDVPGGGQWVYDHPFFMILNVAVGGAFPGSPDDTTTFPQRMLVDYVRVYERD